jgi:hypothetical protein
MAAPRRARTRRLPIALSDAEWARIEAAAKRVSPSLPASAWVRDVALVAAGGASRCKRCGHTADRHLAPGCMVERCACRRFATEEDAG